MAVYDLEEQEQLAELKTWWKQYGNLVTSVLLVCAVSLAGWQGWNWWQRDQAAQASSLYGALQQASTQRDAKRTRDLAGDLIDKFPRTAYAPMGALISARVQQDVGDIKTAQVQLQWVADNASDDAMRALANLRLASVLLDEKNFDGALARMTTLPATPFLVRHHEISGDIYTAQGKISEARTAYEAAISALEAKKTEGETAGTERNRNAAYLEVLRVKLDGLASAGV
jgi:predicted negative regulator of RcsB-dependent stress response